MNGQLAEIEAQSTRGSNSTDIIQSSIELAVNGDGRLDGAVSLVETDGLRCVYAWGFEDDPTGRFLDWTPERHSALALELAARLVAVSDTRTDERVDREHLRDVTGYCRSRRTPVRPRGTVSGSST